MIYFEDRDIHKQCFQMSVTIAVRYENSYDLYW